MDILMFETCWANISEIKTTSDIKFVFNSSTIRMMHGPINIRWVPISTPVFNNCTKIRKTKMTFHYINTALERPCNIIVTKCTQGNNFICIIYNHIFWHQGYWWRCQMTEYKFFTVKALSDATFVFGGFIFIAHYNCWSQPPSGTVDLYSTFVTYVYITRLDIEHSDP